MKKLLLMIFCITLLLVSCEKALCSDYELTQKDKDSFNELQSLYPNFNLQIDSCIMSELKLFTSKIDTIQLKEFTIKVNKYNAIFKDVSVYNEGKYQFKLYPIYTDYSKMQIKEIGMMTVGDE